MFTNNIKTAFEGISCDFSLFKNFVVSVTNLCQGQLKISQENAKLPKKPCNQKKICLFKTLTDVIAASPILKLVTRSIVKLYTFLWCMLKTKSYYCNINIHASDEENGKAIYTSMVHAKRHNIYPCNIIID